MNARSYKTTKGTDLPLLNLRGREYLEVKYRLVWFREDHPDWSIETELPSVTENSAYAKATIRDESGRIIATSHKFENVQGFPDFLEKAETGAIGRALALIGYGTQFCADELDEGGRIVDAPVDNRARRPGMLDNPRAGAPAYAPAKASLAVARESAAPVKKEVAAEPVEAAETLQTETPAGIIDEEIPSEPGEYRIAFGRKYKGRKLNEIPRPEMEGYIRWLESSAVRPGTVLAHQVQILKNAVARLHGPAGGHAGAPETVASNH